MNLLYDKKVRTEQVFTYQINRGGMHHVTNDGDVVIVFVNGRFDHARFPFSGSYDRNEWRILKAIEEEISRIEESLKEPNA